MLFRRLCEYEQIAAKKKKEEEYFGNDKEGVGGGYRTGDTKDPPLVQFNLLKWNASYHMVNHLPPAPWCELCVVGRGKDDPHLRSDLQEKGEQLHVIAFDNAFVKTTSSSGETEQKYATTLVAVDADLFFVKLD